MLEINDQCSIDEAELSFSATTSSGPGGQHVNRSQTRVTLRFDVDHSPSLSEEQRARIHQGLSTRISREGILRISSQRHRSQMRNRDQTIERFVELLGEALREDAPRHPTRTPPAAKRRRVDDKRRRGGVKRLRRKPDDED